MRAARFINLISAFLIILWVYTAGSKLIAFDTFKQQLASHPFIQDFANLLIILLPAAEITAVALLSYTKTRLRGLIFSTLLLISFTAYIILILAGYFSKAPCACGGILQNLGWQAHLWFNLGCLLLTITAAILQFKQKGGCLEDKVGF